MTATHQFPQVHAYGRADIRCRKCRRINSKRVSSWSTVNPFNKNEDGSVRTHKEVMVQAQQQVDEEIERLQAEGRICTKCAQEEAPQYRNDALTADDFVEAINRAETIATQINELRDILSRRWNGRDVELDGRLGKITDAAFQDGKIYVGVNLYSKSARALPGETLVDAQYVSIDKIKLINRTSEP